MIQRLEMNTVHCGERRPDSFAHEQSLVIETKHGLVVFNSCSHTGMTNILADIHDMLVLMESRIIQAS